MTPIQFRMKARAHLDSCKTLLRTSPAQAWYLSGYALEFGLKAAICKKRGWNRWPATPKEAKAWNTKAGRDPKEALFVHNLDRLLEFSKSIAIKRASFQCIDWDKALSWTEQIRYSAEEDISEEFAREHIVEVEKLTDALDDYETLRVLLEVDRANTREFGRFDCLALAKEPNTEKRIIICSWRVPSDEVELRRKNAFLHELVTQLDEDLLARIPNVQFMTALEPMMRGLFMLVAAFTGPVFQHPRQVVHHNLVTGFPPFPPAYLVTAALWNEVDLHNEWIEKGLCEH